MRGLAQERHRVGDLLGVTAPHKDEVVTHQRCPYMDVLGNASEKARRLFWFQCILANGGGGGAGCEPDDKCKNPGALPPFPAWEGVLATEIGEPGRTDGCAFWSEATDWDIKSIISESAVATPDFEIFTGATGLLFSLARA